MYSMESLARRPKKPVNRAKTPISAQAHDGAGESSDASSTSSPEWAARLPGVAGEFAQENHG